jgi:small nuclear ribonucleoprotein (snRNP)-like protein
MEQKKSAEQDQSSSSHRGSATRQIIPTDLHRKSLRLRLEAYYSLIAPDTLSDQSSWQSKFEQIYQKYGGSHEGERKLAAKLAKKYGRAVRLLVARQDSNVEQTASQPNQESGDKSQRSEDWYNLHSNEKSSGDVGFLSDSFDPEAALRKSESEVARVNPWILKCPRLDTVAQFAFQLPDDDPLGRNKATLKRPPSARKPQPTAKKRPRDLHPFESIAQSFEIGPLSVLGRFQHKRVRVLIRYVNAIRGTLTGILVAFDKHMNMILRDVEEIYSPRPSDRDDPRSNVEIEKARRVLISGAKEFEMSGRWIIRTRKMKQLLIRGDHVVSVNRVDENENVSTGVR